MLKFRVDGDRWRGHLAQVAGEASGLVPVAKGNGYGFTLPRLAEEAGRLDTDVLAVGTYPELGQVAQQFAGDLMVLTPWRPYQPAIDPSIADRVIHTISRAGDLAALIRRQPGARIVLERFTSMRRHGLTGPELWQAADYARDRARLEGVAIHLPMAGANSVGPTNYDEAHGLMDSVVGASVGTVFVSHLNGTELRRLRNAYPDLAVRPRVGTNLWLGDRASFRVTATVEDVHPVERGQHYGYRQRTAVRQGHLVVASGGTAHGLGLDAPTGAGGLRSRAAAVARGGLDAVGISRSPFIMDGKHLYFAEPPHMQSSMLFLPGDTRPPEVGDELDVRVRYTATAFDEIQIT